MSFKNIYQQQDEDFEHFDAPQLDVLPKGYPGIAKPPHSAGSHTGKLRALPHEGRTGTRQRPSRRP